MLPCRMLAGLVVLAAVAACGGDRTPVEVTDDRHVFRYIVPAGVTQPTSIHVAGSFNEWSTSARPMQRQADGTWEARVLLGAGTYQYKYVFNGDEWASNMCNDPVWGNPANNNRVDPAVTTCVDDGFGGQNGVLVIP